MHSNNRKDIKYISAGDIVAVIGLKYTNTGDTLCDKNKIILIEKMHYPEPVISISLEPKTQEDQKKLSFALHKLNNEDPSLVISSNKEHSQTILSGMGELHLDIIIDRMKREFQVNCHTGKPQVSYRETIQKSSKQEGKFIKQSGGRGQYGHVIIKIQPIKTGKGFIFINKIFGGAIPKEYIKPIKQGIKEQMLNGVVCGFPIIDIKVTLLDGSFHEVDSSEIAFKTAASIAFKNCVLKASPIILEPIMTVEVTTSDKYMGDVIGDLNKRRGIINKMLQIDNSKIIKAEVPFAEMFGYATILRSITQGKSYYNMKYLKYKKVPNKIVNILLKK